ncbi:MAG TPA: tRNA lysidine(34) synthetase TilS [Mangrovimonas sp.]|nr:tRNA lysidine(34) synthetase TilS [Mangrovimonas sp.]
MLDLFSKYIDKELAFIKDKKLLVAISGGLDSVVLAHLCAQLQLNISLVHCNFNLRGNESDEDESFVLQLAEDLELEVFVESFETETYAQEHKISIQMAARELRYVWFEELASQLHYDYILTAHHADDNLETFLINLSRGTGLDGLVGIPEKNGKLVRPLLPFSREEIQIFAGKNQIKWREDSSNASTKYLRNKLRHDVIPKLKAVNPQFLQNFSKTQQHLRESKQFLDSISEEIVGKVVDRVDGDVKYFNIEKIKSFNHFKTVLYQLFKDCGFNQWNDIEELLDAQTGKYVLSKTHRLLKNREYLVLSNLPEDGRKATLKIFEGDESIETSLGTLTLEDVNAMGQSISQIVYVDKDLLKFPLTVRHWEKGDYFYPFGMQGKKKLSKFFKDEKYSALEKEKALVLCSKDNIVWVLNKRLDNRFKVTQDTQNILKISILT